MSAQNFTVIYDDSTNLSFAFVQFGLLPFMAPIQDSSIQAAHRHTLTNAVPIESMV